MVLFGSILQGLRPRFSMIYLRDFQLLDAAMTKTIDQRVIDHPEQLHVRVADYGTNKLESALVQVSAQGNWLGGLRRYLARGRSAIQNRFATRGPPQVSNETVESSLNLAELLDIDRSSLNF